MQKERVVVWCCGMGAVTGGVGRGLLGTFVVNVVSECCWMGAVSGGDGRGLFRRCSECRGVEVEVGEGERSCCK